MNGFLRVSVSGVKKPGARGFSLSSLLLKILHVEGNYYANYFSDLCD